MFRLVERNDFSVAFTTAIDVDDVFEAGCNFVSDGLCRIGLEQKLEIAIVAPLVANELFDEIVNFTVVNHRHVKRSARIVGVFLERLLAERINRENGGVIYILISFGKQCKYSVVEFFFGFVSLIEFAAHEDFVNFFADAVLELAGGLFGVRDDENLLERCAKADKLCDHQLDGVRFACTCRGFNEKAFGRVEFLETEIFHD